MAVLTIILVPSLSIVTKSSKKNLLYIAFLLHVIFIAPILAVQEKNVAVELKKLDKTAFKKLTAGVHSSETNTIDPSAARIYGKQASVGGDRKAEGRIHLVSSLKIKRQCQLHEFPVWSCSTPVWDAYAAHTRFFIQVSAFKKLVGSLVSAVACMLMLPMMAYGNIALYWELLFIWFHSLH